jgi:hypothetical protein
MRNYAATYLSKHDAIISSAPDSGTPYTTRITHHLPSQIAIRNSPCSHNIMYIFNYAKLC